MSYRAFKRLLGETSLERKCRFLFGAGVVVLITLSFWLYAYQTEHLAYEQAVKTCRLLVQPSLAHHELEQLEKTQKMLDKNQKISETPATVLATLTQAVGHIRPNPEEYQYHILSEKKLENYEREYFRELFRAEDEKGEVTRLRSRDKLLWYYAPVRASKTCVSCHQQLGSQETALAMNEALLLRIRMPTGPILEGIDWNRAILMSTALVTAILIMTGSWIVVRYIIVKPVQHLKDVSDAISAGKLNVRSEIQTGDEFEDLSHAFNRMLRHLVNMQDQLKKVNSDLDHKVDELAQSNLALYESNRLKSDFLATMSHELRTPLNSILGFSDVLLSDPALKEKQQRWVRNVQTSGQKLLNLINDILDLAKIEAGKMQVRIEEFAIHDVCDGLVNMFRPLAEKKNIDVRSQIDPAIPPLRQDMTKLQQILQNLLSNAIKFTPEGGRVLLKAQADARHVTLTVSDTGVGIGLEEQDLVFEKFRQGANPLTREHAGTGLGLSIVKELSKLLGGETALQSELGRGSTFIVRIPLHLSEEPRLEFDLADERLDLSKSQRLDVRLYAGAVPSVPSTRVDRSEVTQLDIPEPPMDSPDSGPGVSSNDVGPENESEAPTR